MKNCIHYLNSYIGTWPVLTALFALSLGLSVSAQQTPSGITFAINTSIKNDTSPPLKSLPMIRVPAELRQIPLPRLNPNRMAAVFTRPVLDRVAQSKEGPAVLIKLVASIDGLGREFPDIHGHPMKITTMPPDANGAVGDTQYVQIVNTFFVVFDKADLIKAGVKSTKPVIPVLGWAPISIIWQGFGGECEQSAYGDPIVQYDKIAKRWIITQLRLVRTGFCQCIAVSTTSNATGPYNRYEFDEPLFNDYPKLGVWPNGYFITYNMLDAEWKPQGARICAYERAKMLAGKPAREIAAQLGRPFLSLLPADFDGIPDKKHLPAPDSPCYLLSLGARENSLDFWKFHVDWNEPGKSTFGDGKGGPNATLDVAPFSDAPSEDAIPQLGTSQKLFGLGERLLYRLAYRRVADHESLVATHSVGGAAIAAPRWYEIRNPGVAPTVSQQGTFSPDSISRWMGSIAMDRSGNIALGYNASSVSSHPSIRITARRSDDADGIMGEEKIVAESSSSQEGEEAFRWGDYSSMSVDPVDDTTFWFTSEYLTTKKNGVLNWSTRIIAFSLAK